MMKARDYLVSKGLAKQGRGKFSNAAKAALDDAIKSGKSFDDWPKSTGRDARQAKRERTPAKGDNARAGGLDIAPYTFPADFRFPEDQYVAKGGGKQYTVREVCNTCRVSLTNHICMSPTILGDIPVEIVRK